ncbi:MAG: DUF4384 domain-containing protein [Pseudomonadota bacterium]
MKTLNKTPLCALTTAAITACSLGFLGESQAASHALIMTINYAGTGADLPGIDADGDMAFKIALGMGVPQSNIRWLRNGDLGLAGITSAIEDLTRNRISQDDKVFIYYSGHGTQIRNTSGGSKCTEGMVTADLKTFSDDKLQVALGLLADKASQVTMLNDSCFSGGQATKSLDRGTGQGEVAKVYFNTKAGSASDADYECNQPVNKTFTRSMGVVARQNSTRMLYVAAAADNEVSWATPRGSTATVAWSQCLASGAADRDGNGIVDGEELRQCAQGRLDRAGGKRQTITLVGEKGLPMSFMASSGASNTLVSNPNRSLETLRRAADPTIAVEITVNNPRLKINQDLLDFSVRTDRPGYLYLLHIGTDGKFYQLFPNSLDSNNYLNAGVHRFPRAKWGIQAHGPAGTGYFMAYQSSSQRNFAKDMSLDGVFAATEATNGAVNKLGIVALDGRYGTSRVATIEEVK